MALFSITKNTVQKDTAKKSYKSLCYHMLLICFMLLSSTIVTAREQEKILLSVGQINNIQEHVKVEKYLDKLKESSLIDNWMLKSVANGNASFTIYTRNETYFIQRLKFSFKSFEQKDDNQIHVEVLQ